jgi:hypothetical protein
VLVPSPCHTYRGQGLLQVTPSLQKHSVSSGERGALKTGDHRGAWDEEWVGSTA